MTRPATACVVRFRPMRGPGVSLRVNDCKQEWPSNEDVMVAIITATDSTLPIKRRLIIPSRRRSFLPTKTGTCGYVSGSVRAALRPTRLRRLMPPHAMRPYENQRKTTCIDLDARARENGAASRPFRSPRLEAIAARAAAGLETDDGTETAARRTGINDS